MFSFYFSVSLQQMNYGMRKHCLQILFEDRSHGVYIALNTIAYTCFKRAIFHVHDLIWTRQQITGNIPTDK